LSSLARFCLIRRCRLNVRLARKRTRLDAVLEIERLSPNQDSGDVELLEPAEAVKLSRLKSNLGADDPLFIGALEDTTAD
jgi:hypothetical protein